MALNEYDEIATTGKVPGDKSIYSDLMDAESQDQKSSLKQSMFVASKTSPDAAAETLKTAQVSGIPADVVSRNPEVVKEKDTIDSIDYGSLIDTNPGLAKFLEDHNNASVAHDDIPNLSEHEKQIKEYGMLETLGRSLNSGMAWGDAALARIPAFLFDAAMIPGNLSLKLFGNEDKQVRSPEWLRNNPVAKYYDAQQEAWKVPELDKSIVGQIGQGDYSGAARSLMAQLAFNAPQQVVILASALTGNPLPGLGYAGLTQASQTNKTAQESGVTPLAATTDAVVQGSLEALLENAGTLGVFRKWENAIAKTAGKQTARQVMKEFGKTMAYSFFAEGNEEFLTQVGQDWADYVTGVNPQAMQGTLQRALDAGLIGGVSGATMTAPTATAAGLKRGREIRQADAARNFYLSLGQTVETSKLRERLPDAHRKYVEQLTQNGPVENIYIPVDAWNMYMQEKGVDPSAAANEIGISKEYDEAVDTNKDLKIPMATWANKVVGTEHYTGLSEDIKFDHSAMTVRQIKDEAAKVKADIEAQNQQAIDIQTSQAQTEMIKAQEEVSNKIADQLKATGRFNEKDSKMLSQLWGNVTRVFGERLGIDPMEFFQQNPVTVKNSETADLQPGQQKMNQGAGEKNLVAMHNIASGGLLHADRMGGLAVPSLSVGKTEHPLEGFGEITLLADKSLIDPKKASNKVFNADIYSPRYPSVTYELNSKRVKEIAEMVRKESTDLGRNFGSDLDANEANRKGVDALRDSTIMQLHYLRKVGKDVSIVPKKAATHYLSLNPEIEKFLTNSGIDEALFKNKEFLAAYDKVAKAEAQLDYDKAIADNLTPEEAEKERKYTLSLYYEKGAKKKTPNYNLVYAMKNEIEAKQDDGKPDYYSTQSAVRNAIAPIKAEYDSWIDKNFRDIIAKEKIYDGEDRNYNRKYLPHTLENVVRIMKRELQSGENFNYGLGNLRATVAKRYHSIKEIQAGRSQILSKENFEKVKQFTDQEFEDIINEAYKVAQNKDFGVGDRFITVLQDGMKQGNIQKELEAYGFPGMDIPRIQSFLSVLRDMPTEYFEAKLQRVVGLHEFAGAVVPKGTSPDVLNVLTKHGIPYLEYERNDEKSRAMTIEQLGAQREILFQNKSDALGAIIFGKKGGLDIHLLRNANYSTFIHETGHAFLELLRRAAATENAPADIKDMEAKVLKWFGVESWDKVGVKEHEQWARGFEKYIGEGVAPSEGLRQAFARFRVWLISVYKTLLNLNVDLSDDIRSVMSRMLATDAEITAVQAETGDTVMIQDPISILGEEKGQRYLDAVMESRQEAEASLQLKLMEEYQRERKSWWLDELKKIREEVAKEVNARPEQIALSILQRGKMPDGTDVPDSMKDLKINRQDLIAMLSTKYDVEVAANDYPTLEAEFNIEQLEGALSEIEQFRKDVGKVRKYDGNYLAEELSKIPKRYITTNKFARTLDEVASDLGFESDMAVIDRMIENEDAYKSITEELIAAKKEFRSIKKQAKSAKYESIKSALNALPRRITSNKGLPVDVVGQLFGQSSGEQFIDILSRTPKRNDLIKQISRDQMVQEHGEIYGDKEAMHEQAMHAIHNEKREFKLRMELEYLLANHVPTAKDLIRTFSARIPSSQSVKKYAGEIIGRTALNQISPRPYELAERRMAKAAGEALAKGKFDEAFDFKRKELLNYELYRAAIDSRETIKNSMDNFKKIMKSDDRIAKSRDLDYVNAARSVLAIYGLGGEVSDPYKFIEQTKAYDPDTYETIVALIDAAVEGMDQNINLPDITFDQFMRMKEAVDAIWEISKRSKQIQINDQKMEIDDIRQHLIDRINAMIKPGQKAGYTKTAGDNEKMARGIMGAVAQGRRVESWADLMDGGDTKGWFTQAIWNPISEGASKFRIDNKKYTEKFLELIKPIEKSLASKEIVSDELKHIFRSKGELLGAMLHTGNDSNLSKLLRGRGWGVLLEDGTLDSSRWDAFVKRMQESGILNKADYDFIQSVWDLFDSLKPAAQKAHKEMYGHYFSTITTREIVTPWGTYRGGYAPAIVDPFVSEDAAIRKEREDAQTINNSYMFPTAGRGFTKARVERYAAPLAIDLRMVPQHINKVLRFTHIEPRVKDVGRLIRDPEFREVLRDLDPTVGQNMLAPWLQRSAQQIVETPDKSWAGWKLWKELRTRSGINIMSANVINTLQQFTGISIGAVKVRPKYLRNSLWNYMKNPKMVSDSVHDKSEFMRTRMSTQIMEIQNTIEDLITNQGKYEKAIEFAKRHAYFMQQGTQNVVDMVVWPAAYDQSIARGNDDKQAVRDADAAVRLTQGDFSPENISNLESGNAFARAFLMFYSYFNMQANLLGTEFGKVANELGLKRGAGRLFYIYMFGFMIPAVVSEIILKSLSGSDWDDNDDDNYLDDILAAFFGSQFRTATAMFPFVGQVVNTSVNAFNKKWYDDHISTSPVYSMLENASHAPYSLYKAIAEDGNKKAAIRDTLSLLGLITAAPLRALARPLGYVADVQDGKVFPDNALDFTRGLISGK